MHLIPSFQLIALLLMLGLPGTLIASASNINIEYDQHRDRIRVQANNASLTNLLAQIAKKTGMTIQIDPAVEKTVSFQLPQQSLQQALQKICKGLSYVIEYSTVDRQRSVISGMKLLPKGKQDSGQLVSVAILNARASRSATPEGSEMDITGGQIARDYSGNHKTRSRIKARPATRMLTPEMYEAELAAQPTHVAPTKPGTRVLLGEGRKTPSIQMNSNDDTGDHDSSGSNGPNQ